MSRTNRNTSFHPVCNRKPRGHKNAKANNVRPGAVPPHPWFDEKFISDEAIKCMERREKKCLVIHMIKILMFFI